MVVNFSKLLAYRKNKISILRIFKLLRFRNLWIFKFFDIQNLTNFRNFFDFLNLGNFSKLPAYRKSKISILWVFKLMEFSKFIYNKISPINGRKFRIGEFPNFFKFCRFQKVQIT